MKMNQELEIEFKNLLTEEEFQRLLAAFSITEKQFLMQENYYFDTPNFSLKDNGAALRIRTKEGAHTLTLKQPVKDGLLETHQKVTEKQAISMLNGGPLIEGEINNIINFFDIDVSRVQYFGSLKTSRAEINYKSGILVFDHSHYLQVDDYEIEFEVTDRQTGEIEFNELLQSFQIPKRETENKIRRFARKLT